ncbi:acyloxyacyl hydrolase [Litoribacillus peritrichatus]|uniref:Acyloxyacyl hydrolase n=1 Tax=Litoribacillus peritrichatus TaxID=718191 RepID=A0ABP7MQB9_9GAMM
MNLFRLTIKTALNTGLIIAVVVLSLLAPGAEADEDYLPQEVRLGMLAHNLGLIASKKEHGTDVNAELVWGELAWRLGGKPTLGVAINNLGYTSFVYSGLSWSFYLDEHRTGLFVIPFLGLAVHDGELEPKGDHRGMGCRVVFREAIDIGWRFSEQYALSLVTDHLSHGGFCTDRNQGLDSSGVRLHIHF